MEMNLTVNRSLAITMFKVQAHAHALGHVPVHAGLSYRDSSANITEIARLSFANATESQILLQNIMLEISDGGTLLAYCSFTKLKLSEAR